MFQIPVFHNQKTEYLLSKRDGGEGGSVSLVYRAVRLRQRQSGSLKRNWKVLIKAENPPE